MKKLLIAGVGDLNKRVATGWNQLGGFFEGARLSQEDKSLGFKQHSLDLSIESWPDTQAMTVCVALSARERTIAGGEGADSRHLRRSKAWATLDRNGLGALLLPRG